MLSRLIGVCLLSAFIGWRVILRRQRRLEKEDRDELRESVRRVDK